MVLQRLQGCQLHSFNLPQLCLAAGANLQQGALHTAAGLRPSTSTQVRVHRCLPCVRSVLPSGLDALCGIQSEGPPK